MTEQVAALFGRISFELDGRTFAVPARPLEDWLAVALAGDFTEVVPGMLDPADAGYLYERILDEYDPLGEDTCARIGEWVLEELTGRPWWEVTRSVREALAGWNSLDSWATGEVGVDVRTLDLRRFCNLVVRFVLLIVGDEEAREGWLASFSAPPPGADLSERSEWSDEAVAADALAGLNAWASVATSLNTEDPE